MRTKVLVLVLVLHVFSVSLFAQKGYSAYGLKAGILHSKITNLKATILSEPYFINYDMWEKPRIGWTAGLFYNYRFENPVIGLQFDMMYARQGSDLHFVNYEKDFKYQMNFNYQYINISGLFKLYPAGGKHDHEFRNDQNGWAGLHFFVGGQAGVPVAADNIVFKSEGPGWDNGAFGSDLQQQEELRKVLKGKYNSGVIAGCGYEFQSMGLTLEFRAVKGLTDVIETQSNAYNFREVKNINTSYFFTVGWDFYSQFNK